jgi:acyl-CoA reductase-like NAD-dependent aldehyde dehydrogenase
VTDVGNDAAIVQQEQFGPVLPLVAYEDEAEAVRWANGIEYGLSASVWSSAYSGHVSPEQVAASSRVSVCPKSSTRTAAIFGSASYACASAAEG